jgi:glutathionylspermidine synthase
LYWTESGQAVISRKAEKLIFETAFEVYNMHLEAVDKVINDPLLLTAFNIPSTLWPAIKTSWSEKQPDMQGRFDFNWRLKMDHTP